MNKEAIKSALSAIPTGDLSEKSKNLLATLGYRSERTHELSGTVHDFFEEFPSNQPEHQNRTGIPKTRRIRPTHFPVHKRRNQR